MSADGGKPPPPRPGDFVPEDFCDEGEYMLDTVLLNVVCRRLCFCERVGPVSWGDAISVGVEEESGWASGRR